MKRLVGALALISLGACGGAVAPASSSVDGGTVGTPNPTPTTTPTTTPPPTPTQTPPATGGCADCLPSTILWYFDGGLVAYNEQSQLGDCRTYKHERYQSDPSSPSLTCSTQLGGCGAPPVSVREIDAALANSDVVGAFEGGIRLFGSDPRGCDGAVLRIQIGTKMVEVGGDCAQAGACGGSTTCTPVPTGLRALADVLQLVDKQELLTPDCAAFR